MRARTQLVTAIACVGLVAAACGDDGDADGEDADAEERDDDQGTGDTADLDEDVATEEVDYDTGVDEDTIYVGMLTDLSGPYRNLVNETVEAQEVYFEILNEEGGIAGRDIELIIEDEEYDIQRHQERYPVMRDEVAIISQSAGSPHTASVADQMVQDDLVGFPLTWYSGWADPEIGENLLETYTNYCIEAMNAVEWLHENEGVETLAIASVPGEFGGDSSAGAEYAAEELGLEIVYDGNGEVTPTAEDNPTPDQSAVVDQIVSSDPDLVWVPATPEILGSMMSPAVNQGFEGLWSGPVPTYDFRMVGTDLGSILDEYYISSDYVATWGTDVEGMDELMDAMVEHRPDLQVSDNYVIGWTQAQATHQILQLAAQNGDLTRAGITEAAKAVDVDFRGLAPEQSWAADDPNENIVRESYIYDVVQDEYNEAPLSDEGGNTGRELLEGPYTGSVAENYEWDGPCFTE